MEYFDFSNSITDNYIQEIIVKCCDNLNKMKILYKDDNQKKLILTIDYNNHEYHIILEHKDKSDTFYFTDKDINNFKNDNEIYEEIICKIDNNKKITSNSISFNTVNILMKYFDIKQIELSEKINVFTKSINSIVQGLFIDYDYILNIFKENHKNTIYEDDFEQSLLYKNKNRIVLSKLDGLLFIIDKNNDDMELFVQDIDLLSASKGYKQLNEKIENNSITLNDKVLEIKNGNVIFANPDYINIFISMFKNIIISMSSEYNKFPNYPIDITSPEYIYNYKNMMYGSSPLTTLSYLFINSNSIGNDGHIRNTNIIFRDDIKNKQMLFNTKEEEQSITYLSDFNFPQNLDKRWIPELEKYLEYLLKYQPTIISCLLSNSFKNNNKQNLKIITDSLEKNLNYLKEDNNLNQIYIK